MFVDVAWAAFADRYVSRHGCSYLSIKVLDDVPIEQTRLHFMNDLGHLTQQARDLQIEGSTSISFQKASHYAGNCTGASNHSILVDFAEHLIRRRQRIKIVLTQRDDLFTNLSPTTPRALAMVMSIWAKQDGDPNTYSQATSTRSPRRPRTRYVSFG